MHPPDLPAPPETRSTRTLVRGAKFDYEEMILADAEGRTSVRHHIRHPGAVCVLPLLDTPQGSSIVFVRNHRPALGAFLLELPAGGLEPGEEPEKAAGRELAEETGYRAATLTPLGRFYTSPGLADELMWAFVATGLAPVGQDLDEGEVLTVEERPAADVWAMIRDTELLDGKSLATILLASQRGFLEAPGA
jgi:ADP-ribose pyrophosphatase